MFHLLHWPRNKEKKIWYANSTKIACNSSKWQETDEIASTQRNYQYAQAFNEISFCQCNWFSRLLAITKHHKPNAVHQWHPITQRSTRWNLQKPQSWFQSTSFPFAMPINQLLNSSTTSVQRKLLSDYEFLCWQIISISCK